MLEHQLRPNDLHERCGVVLEDGTILELTNIAEEPAGSFEIDPTELLEQLETGRVKATWHTHIDSGPNLSGADYDGFLAWPELEHFVIGREAGQVAVAKFVVEDGLVLRCE